MSTKGFIANFVLLLLIGVGNAQLSSNFYDTTCPQFASLVNSAVSTAVSQESRMGASLLRLHFHDCFVQGCDASILLDDTDTFTGEKTAAPNANSVRGFDVIDNIKAQAEGVCPGVVSCADILALAARDAVVALGGSTWTVPFGRRDSTTASISDANSQLPSPFSDLSRLISDFSDKGFTTSEMVALSGGHTIGQARCAFFRNRIYNETNIDSGYATSLQGNCPSTDGTGDNNLTPFDYVTPYDFDNNYYQNLVAQSGLLHSDQELLNSAATSAQVYAYSDNSASFFNDFAAAMVKMSYLSPLTGTQGQIRTDCRRVN